MARIAWVTGADGVGKSSLILGLHRSHGLASAVEAVPAPQYHVDPDAPHGRRSAIFEAMSRLADQQGWPAAKAAALFLQLSLAGDVLAHARRAAQPEWVVMERAPLLDALAYARFYRPALDVPLDAAAWRAAVEAAPAPLGPGAWAAAEAWARAIAERRNLRPLAGGLESLPAYIAALFDLPSAELVASLRAVVGLGWPEVLVVLSADPAVLAARLAAKQASGDGAPTELHEHPEALAQVQEALLTLAEQIRPYAPGMHVVKLDVGALSAEEACQRFSELLGLDAALVVG